MSFDQKDEMTETLRQRIKEAVTDAIETSRAEASLCSLSFQSKVHPERHIWLDSENESIRLDLEDWQDGAQWDDAVARVTVESLDEAVYLVKAWLFGENMAQYSNLNRDYGVVARKAVISS